MNTQEERNNYKMLKTNSLGNVMSCKSATVIAIVEVLVNKVNIAEYNSTFKTN